MTLTEASRYFVEHAVAGIVHLDHAVKTAGTLARGDEGCLRIGLHLPPVGGFLTDLLARHRQQHPGIGIEFSEGRAVDIIRPVRDGQLDVAFVVGTPPAEDCHSRLLWSEAMMAVLPIAHPLDRHAPAAQTSI